jgi:hypothetical protein
MDETYKEVLHLYRAYETKILKPETALEIASDFTLDLINVFGDSLSDSNPLMDGWREFVPFEFILGLNKILARFKQSGYTDLDGVERTMLADTGVLLGTLIRESLRAHPDSFPDEEHYQLPNEVAKELLELTGTPW